MKHLLLPSNRVLIGLVGPTLELGGLYDPSLLPDFDPRLFGLVSSKLAQQEVNAKDGTLVAPWEMKDALRPGTLVAVEAALIIYHFCGSAPSTVCDLLLFSLRGLCAHVHSTGVPNASPACTDPGRIPFGR